MILIIGLGNPGKKYENTRHNIGKKIVKEIGQNFDFPKFSAGQAAGKLKALISRKKINNQEIILALPNTYMNESGQSVKLLVSNIRDLGSSLWVVHDDIDLPLGKIRISQNRSSAGHKGVQSIIDQVGTQNFIRFRVGIQTEISSKLPSEKFVLQKFNKKEQSALSDIIQLAQDATEMALKTGIETAMNKYN